MDRYWPFLSEICFKSDLYSALIYENNRISEATLDPLLVHVPFRRLRKCCTHLNARGIWYTCITLWALHNNFILVNPNPLVKLSTTTTMVQQTTNITTKHLKNFITNVSSDHHVRRNYWRFLVWSWCRDFFKINYI